MNPYAEVWYIREQLPLCSDWKQQLIWCYPGNVFVLVILQLAWMHFICTAQFQPRLKSEYKCCRWISVKVFVGGSEGPPSPPSESQTVQLMRVKGVKEQSGTHTSSSSCASGRTKHEFICSAQVKRQLWSVLLLAPDWFYGLLQQTCPKDGVMCD